MRNRWIALIALAMLCATALLAQYRPPSGPSAPKVPRGQNSGGTSVAPQRDTSPFSISGFVRDSEGRGLSGAQVNATSRNSSVTDSAGQYSIEGLDRSVRSYSVKVSKAGYTFNPGGANVTPPAKGNVQNLNFRAAPPAAKPKK